MSLRSRWNPYGSAGRSSTGVVTALMTLFYACSFAVITQAQPQTPLAASAAGIGIDQKLDAQVPLDLEFRDEAGKTVRLGDYFGKKPVILSLVYYDCPMLCTLSLNGLLSSLQHLTFSAGDEFTVLTVSFDPREKSELAAAKKRVYLTLYNRRSGWEGWHFLTGDQESIRRLAGAAGFKYKWDAASGQYVHATGIMLLTPQGRIARYFYGIEYPATDLRLGLIDAAARKIGTPVDAVLLLCSHYDPVQGKYGLVITRVLQLAGAATVLILGSFMLVWFLRDRRKSAGLSAGS